jgi:hypothetical protein
MASMEGMLSKILGAEMVTTIWANRRHTPKGENKIVDGE